MNYLLFNYFRTCRTLKVFNFQQLGFEKKLKIREWDVRVANYSSDLHCLQTREKRENDAVTLREKRYKS